MSAVAEARVLVTGGAGFIGSHVTELLLERGHSVIGLDSFDDYYDPKLKHRNLREVRASAARLEATKRYQFIEGSILDRELVKSVFRQQQPTKVVHLAALAGVRASIDAAGRYFDVNVGGTINLLDAAVQRGGVDFVFASTSSVYGNTETVPFVETDRCDQPLAPYPASKRAGELLGYSYHNNFDLNFTALRFFTVYGPRNRPDMMAGMLLTSVEDGTPVTVFGGGLLKRDWTYVGDIAQGVAAAAERPLGYRQINIGRGEPILLKEFIDIFRECSGGRLITRDGEKPRADVDQTFADISVAARLLDYSPKTSVQEGVERLWSWHQGLKA